MIRLNYAVLCALTLFWAEPSLAGPRSVGLDYRNRPDWRALVGFDEAVISPRAVHAADSLRAAGVRVRFWVQTVAAAPGGRKWTHSPYDRDLWELLDRTGGIARYPDGDTVWVTQVDDPLVRDVVLLDLRRPEVWRGWVEVLERHGDAWLLDGCRSLRWLFDSYVATRHDPPLPPEFWAPWSAGYDSVAAALDDDYCQCDKVQPGCTGVVLEKVGQALNPLPKVLSLALTRPAVLLLGEGSERLRRATAAIAYLTDAGVMWGHATSRPNRRIPELDLELGEFHASASEIAPGLWIREATRGAVLLNLSGSPWRTAGHVVPPGDALIVEGAP